MEHYMKKLLTLSLFALALSACKTEVEKDISLKSLLNEPVKEETALLNVEILSCHNREDSRLESDDLIKIKAKIPTIFQDAKYKECYSKRANSFAVFEIPIAVGKAEQGQEIKHDIAVLSNDRIPMVIRSSGKLSENIRNFLKSEFVPNFDFHISLNVTNDTDKEQGFNIYSAYLDEGPVSVSQVDLKKDEKIKIRLSNASADSLWRYKGEYNIAIVLGEKMPIFSQK